MDKLSLDDVINKMKAQRLSLGRSCKVLHYLPINEKIKLFNEYKMLTEKDLDKIPLELIPVYGFICFHVLLVKYYTNIDISMSFKNYDKLMENNIISELVGEINSEYIFLKNMINANVEVGER